MKQSVHHLIPAHFKEMDRRLFQAIVDCDLGSFRALVGENGVSILEQRTAESRNTPLHLASKLGHAQLVEEILKLCPHMVSMQNSKLDAPFHAACSGGHTGVLRLLMEVLPWEIFRLNGEGESPLCIASKNGHSEVVKLLVTLPGMLEIEEEMSDRSSVHVAALRGYEGNLQVLNRVNALILLSIFPFCSWLLCDTPNRIRVSRYRRSMARLQNINPIYIYYKISLFYLYLEYLKI